MNTFIESKGFKIAVIGIGSFVIALIIFATGVSVGLHKARFSYRFGENYERNFMGPRPGMMNRGGMIDRARDFEGRGFRNAFSTSGTIISVSDSTIMVKDRDGKENTVAVSDSTLIKSGRDTIKINDLKTNDQVTVIGKPGDNGAIDADLIRVFPAPATNGSQS